MHEHQQSAIKGSFILFEQDDPQIVSNLFSPETMNSNIFLHFVGHKGEFDSLYKKYAKQISRCLWKELGHISMAVHFTCY